MNSKIIFAILASAILVAGCGRVNTHAVHQDEPLSSMVATTNNTSTKSSGTTSKAIDYHLYIKKTWIASKGNNNDSFFISQIENGKITGRFSGNLTIPYPGVVDNFTGTINQDTAECQFSDAMGNKGKIELVFKPKDEMEATIKFTDKSPNNTVLQPQEGTFQFIPYNLKASKEFRAIKNQSFMVNLNSWGKVKFVSGKLIGGNHIPVVFYLTNLSGDILYDFNATLPYRVDVKAVSFADVNQDGLKDIIIIVTDEDGLGGPLATVYLQKANGSFINDPKLDQSINDSGNNKDIRIVKNYLAQR